MKHVSSFLSFTSNCHCRLQIADCSQPCIYSFHNFIASTTEKIFQNQHDDDTTVFLLARSNRCLYFCLFDSVQSNNNNNNKDNNNDNDNNKDYDEEIQSHCRQYCLDFHLDHNTYLCLWSIRLCQWDSDTSDCRATKFSRKNSWYI